MIKSKWDEEERRGLTQEEIRISELWLVDHRLHTRVSKVDSLPMYELYLKGTTLKELSRKYPQFEYERIILAAVLDDWFSERESAMDVVKKAVTEKVVTSMVNQVNLLSSMVEIAGKEWQEEMDKYLENPQLNPKPSVRINNLKDLAQVQEMMGKAVTTSTPVVKVLPKAAQEAAPSAKPSKAKANSAIVDDAKGKTTLTVGDLLRMKTKDETQN